MNFYRRKFSLLLIFLFMIHSCFLLPRTVQKTTDEQIASKRERPKNLVLFIGDGMGKNQLRVARESRFGHSPDQLFMFSFPVFTEITTHALGGQITDSAAAASAMATGQKYKVGRLSFDESSGLGRQPHSVTEIFQSLGKSVGIVTTDQLIGGTPSAFIAHLPSRTMTSEIVKSYLFGSRPQIMLGGNSPEFDHKTVIKSGAYLVRQKEDLLKISQRKNLPAMILGLFGFDRIPYVRNRDETIPSLPEMAVFAQEVLAHDPDGYFLLIEGGRIDFAAHENNLDYLVDEILEFDDTIRTVLEKNISEQDTLFVVTADHETGGLAIESHQDEKYPSSLPFKITWRQYGHTSAPVFLFASGPGADKFRGAHDNTDIFKIIAQLFK